MIWYVGDIHGMAEHVAAIDSAAVEAGVNTIVQVGDFGIHWPGIKCPLAKYFNSRTSGPTWLTCGGNHDNWPKFFEAAAEQGEPNLVELATGCYFVQRGCVHTISGIKHIFFGGAESTDKHMRVEGRTWFSEETPGYGEFSNFAGNLESERPEVVVTHEAPSRVPISKLNRDRMPTPRSLDNILLHGEHKPSRWYFGHHHIIEDWDISGIKFYCCGLHGGYLEG